MAVARPNLNGALSLRVEGRPVRGAEVEDVAWRWRIRRRRGQIRPLRGWIWRLHAGVSRSRVATTGGGGGGVWQLAAAGEGGRRTWRTRWRLAAVVVTAEAGARGGRGGSRSRGLHAHEAWPSKACGWPGGAARWAARRARWGKEVGQRGRWRVAPEPERPRFRCRCRPRCDYAFGRGNPTEGIVEIPLLSWQGSLGENLVQFFGRMTTVSFGVATLVRASFLSLRVVVVLLAWWRRPTSSVNRGASSGRRRISCYGGGSSDAASDGRMEGEGPSGGEALTKIRRVDEHHPVMERMKNMDADISVVAGKISRAARTACSDAKWVVDAQVPATLGAAGTSIAMDGRL
uniref:OSJNBa0065J03.23 protein n=1 Tax=Oryza sativa subsp. japonica TaxID=39947 RepID=Q7XNH6_ORYSJ|nr:OSJNBb0032D24.17 [Oryza sativa Japonica Group]CAE75908.1 OSJNBa0065J03.23 [Oryza sativa Japonica Group]